MSSLKRNQGSLRVHSFILRGCSCLIFPITCLLWDGSCETLSQAARVPSLWLILFIGTDLSKASLIDNWDLRISSPSPARVAGRQTEQVQTQKRLLASFVFVASPVCVCGQVHRAAPVVDQTNCLESQLLAWLRHKNLCCSHRNLVLNESIISGKPKIRWIKHSFCSYPREGLCKGIWICSYAQYATGSRNRTSSSSTN